MRLHPSLTLCALLSDLLSSLENSIRILAALHNLPSFILFRLHYIYIQQNDSATHMNSRTWVLRNAGTSSHCTHVQRKSELYDTKLSELSSKVEKLDHDLRRVPALSLITPFCIKHHNEETSPSPSSQHSPKNVTLYKYIFGKQCLYVS